MTSSGGTEHCRICPWTGPVPDTFVIDRAPRSVNDLPLAGSAPGESTRRISLWECPACGHMQLREECKPESWRAAVTAAGLSPVMRTQRLALFARMRAMSQGASVLEIGAGEACLSDSWRNRASAPAGWNGPANWLKRGAPRDLTWSRATCWTAPWRKPRSRTSPASTFSSMPRAPPRCFCASPRPAGLARSALVEVPNFEKDLETERSHDLVAEHLSYFTSRTLRLCLESSGFEVLSMEPFWHGDDIIAWVTPRQPHALADWAVRDPALGLLRAFLDAGTGSQALWGASHQALTLLGMLEREWATRFHVIADSSPRKQGRMDPAWGIPIVSPQEMVATNPGQVMIMAAGFSSEVAGQLRAMGYRGRVAILTDGVLREVD